MRLRTVKSKLPKSIKRITILKTDSVGNTASGGMVIKKKRKRKKQSKGLVRIWERSTRRSAKSNKSFADNYLSRHRRSNKKRRDGWLRDYSYNTMRAGRKSGKKFKLSRLFG